MIGSTMYDRDDIPVLLRTGRRFAHPTVVSAAYASGHLAVVEMLTEAGADLEATDAMGSTPLHKASLGKHSKVVRALMEAGANVNSRDFEGGTPLYR